MDYEKRFKKLVIDLLEVLVKHINEWDEAERGIFDVYEMLKRAEADLDKPNEPVPL